MVKKRLITLGIVMTIILGLMVALCLCIYFSGNIGTYKGESVEAYTKHVSGSHYYSDMPDEMQDFRFICKKMGVAASTVIAFSLSGETYDDYVEQVAEKEIHPGYDELSFVGKNVAETYDCYDSHGSYIGVPKSGFEYVIDDDFSEYEIIYYSAYRGAGVDIELIAVNSATGRVVAYKYDSN